MTFPQKVLRPALRKGIKRYFIQPVSRARWRMAGKAGRSEAFSRIYEERGWPSRGSTVSGSGSELDQTAEIRAAIPVLVAELGVSSLLDAPCGDSFWIQQCDLGISSYLGVDIVPELVESNVRKYGNESRKFRIADIVTDSLPRADLVLCRDCLVHLPFTQARAAVLNLKASGAEYLLTTTFTELARNSEIPRIGEWRRLNLEKEPFSFPEPLVTLNEGCTEADGRYADKALGLWRFSDLFQ
jgi:hypothetical protein